MLMVAFQILHFRPPRNLDSKATIKINDKQFEIEASDLQLIQNLGRGAFGIVDKMMHRPSGAILAVKVYRDRTRDCQEIAIILV